MPKEIGKLTLTISPEALRSIIEGGRLLELADTVAKEAAAQISSQLIEQVAAAALKGDLAKSGSGASAAFIFDGGDFGTVPPRPRWALLISTSSGEAFSAEARPQAQLPKASNTAHNSLNLLSSFTGPFSLERVLDQFGVQAVTGA